MESEERPAGVVLDFDADGQHVGFVGQEVPSRRHFASARVDRNALAVIQ